MSLSEEATGADLPEDGETFTMDAQQVLYPQLLLPVSFVCVYVHKIIELP